MLYVLFVVCYGTVLYIGLTKSDYFPSLFSVLVYIHFNRLLLDIQLIYIHALGSGSYRFSVTKPRKFDTGRS